MFRGQWHYNRNRHLVCYRVHGDSGLGCSDKHNCFCSLSNLFTHWNCSFTFWIEVFMNIGKTKECVKYLYWIILLAYISIYTQVLHNWILFIYYFIFSSSGNWTFSTILSFILQVLLYIDWLWSYAVLAICQPFHGG